MYTAARVLIKLGQGEIPCLFHIITGLYCPGCGGTRAAAALLRGQILKSLVYNPLPAFLLFGGLWCAAAVFLERRRGKASSAGSLPRPVGRFLWLLLAVTAVEFLIKNLLLTGMQIDLHAVAAAM